jgi:hypothetical protein
MEKRECDLVSHRVGEYFEADKYGKNEETKFFEEETSQCLLVKIGAIMIFSLEVDALCHILEEHPSLSDIRLK